MCKRKKKNLGTKAYKENLIKFNIFSFVGNIVAFVVDIAGLLLFISFIVVFVGSIFVLLNELFGAGYIKVYEFLKQQSCSCSCDCFFRNCSEGCSCSCYQDYINTLISFLSLSLTGFLIPLITMIITAIFSSKAASENLAKELAKAKNINCYLLMLPLGAWGNLSVLYQKEKISEEKLLSDYKYALHLLFESELFQAYNTKLKAIQCLNYLDKNDKGITLWKDNKNAVSFDSDVTGVREFEESQNCGTNLTALIDECCDQYIVDNLIENNFVPKKLIFTIKFKENTIKLRDRWKQFFSSVTTFHITRTIFGWIVSLIRRYVHYNFELTVIGKCPTDERYSQYQFDILDVEMKQVRKRYKKKEKSK